MKITNLSPLIISPNPEEVIAIFEALGFERRHTKTNVDDKGITSIRLKDKNGFAVDVSETTKLKTDLVSMKLNVDNFEEAYNFLLSKGFKNIQGDHVVVGGAAETAMMVSPSGFSITICHHIKKDDK